MRPERAFVSLLAVLACSEAEVEPEDRPVPPIHTPMWAFEPWISKDISSTDDTRDFVRGFEEREIPVGCVVLDSPWETNYNTFTPHPVRYHDFGALVAELHAKSIRVVLWTTQMINEDSFDVEPGGDVYPETPVIYREALAKGYFINGGEKFFWWKGTGAAIDFENREGVRWWHRLQDQVLDLGIDGWKLDFGDSYVTTATVATAKGITSHQAYSEAYYRDFFAYGVHKRGPELVTMVRAWDESYQFPGRFFARPEHAPVVWMGDNRRDYAGLADALDHLFRSSRAGYVVGGSDIGGYLDRNDRDFLELIPFDVVNFARWTAVGAMTPFMQLHGRANITPWTVPERADEIVELYRYWSILHHELVPFFYSLAEEAYARAPGAGPIVQPIGDEADWPGDYRFLSGGAFLVAPILDATGVREVELPAGARWYDWWAPDSPALEGGAVVTASVARDIGRVPLYVKEGAIVPARSAGPRSVLTSAGVPAGRLTLAIWPAAEETTFAVHATETAPAFAVRARRESEVVIALDAIPEPIDLRVRTAAPPSAVTEGGAAITGWRFDAANASVWIELAPSGAARELRLSP